MLIMCGRVITFITGNSRKLQEVLSIIGSDFPCHICNQNLDLVEIQGTIEEVIKAKCQEAYKKIGGPVLVEDTSLCFEAMNDLPGPFIKWFLQKLKPIGLYKMLEGFENKSAKVICSVAYHDGQSDSSQVLLFQGITEGSIVFPRNIPDSFGFDDCFQPNGSVLTFSQMTVEEKNRISHRFKAFQKVKEYFASLGSVSETR